MDLVVRARRAGLRVEELAYVIAPRRAGDSKTASSALGFARRGLRYLATAVKLALREPRRSAAPVSPSAADSSRKPAADNAASTSGRDQ